ncbi:hypothetical protein J7T55_012282 [Diaporthe amygdali]|uniref:uncharacterized protein n=1 Tax=Phomopsis amygdali TaxID=1214568 RepID=UPI0022FE0D7C|nr:uncharacterized protein J7T55_012282 [Diaporthe amygdali]KAJ0123812.1 hypothetical protein J7T55_012282 [Diaporthe amygdali]
MNRRGGEGPMDGLEFQNAQFDKSSPFIQFAQQPPPLASHNSAGPIFAPNGANPFSKPGAPKNGSPLRQQNFPPPPGRSIFSPSIVKQHTAPALRNPAFTTARASTPAFTTPQKDRHEDSTMFDTPMDDSPALTDASGPADSPDFDDSALLDSMNLSTPDQPTRRNLFSEKKSGKGDLPRYDWFQRDKVRKRVRMERDRDIGSTRSRLPNGRDEDESDEDEPIGRRNRRKQDLGWLHRILTSISSNPNAPMIISWYLQVLFNAACGGVVLWMAWGIISAIRGEVLYSSEKARAQLMEEMNACSRRYLENRCSPIEQRLPALEGMCNDWETCMNQDSNVVAGVKASAGHLADILNEFFSRLSWKATVILSSFSIIAMFACNIAFSKFRHNYREHNLGDGHPAAQYQHMAPMGFPMSPEKNQAYIFAPIGHTPKHIRRAFLQDDTESEASPDSRLLPPPRTPSRRSPSKLDRSPSKTDRSRSPSKRSTVKKLEW